MICGIIFSLILALISQKGKMRNILLTINLTIGAFYLIVVELFRFLFHGNNF
jgi:holin-like protein